MENGDDWLANDKIQHFVLCFSITIIVSFLASRTRSSFLRRHSTSLGSIVSLFAGAGKEVSDEIGFFQSAGASVRDAVADIIGVLVAVVVLSFYNSFCYCDRSETSGRSRGVEIV